MMASICGFTSHWFQLAWHIHSIKPKLYIHSHSVGIVEAWSTETWSMFCLGYYSTTHLFWTYNGKTANLKFTCTSSISAVYLLLIVVLEYLQLQWWQSLCPVHTDGLTHWGGAMHICVSKLGYHWIYVLLHISKYQCLFHTVYSKD